MNKRNLPNLTLQSTHHHPHNMSAIPRTKRHHRRMRQRSPKLLLRSLLILHSRRPTIQTTILRKHFSQKIPKILRHPCQSHNFHTSP